MEPQNEEYLTISQVAKKFPIFTESSLRWHRIKNTNNFNNCVRKIRGKIIIHVPSFVAWIESNKA